MTEPGVTRRSILRGAAVTAAAGATGYVVASRTEAAQAAPDTAAANGYGPDQSANNRLAAVEDIPAGGGLIIEDALIVLVRAENGDVAGFSATCTHQGCTVGSIEDGVIICPCHGSHFDLATGEPVAGPANLPLPPIAVEVRGNDVFTG